jgi:TonB family protein
MADTQEERQHRQALGIAVDPLPFTLLGPEEGEPEVEHWWSVANIVIAVAAVSLVLFVVFLVGRVFSPAVPRPAAVRNVRDVKPDAVYTNSPSGSLPGSVAQAATGDQDIIYFAPISSVLPVLVSRTEPLYPADALKAGEHGSVRMQIKISAAGAPTDPTVIQSPGFGMDDRALKAVMAWRFRPAQLDGKPVGAAAWVEVHFREK